MNGRHLSHKHFICPICKEGSGYGLRENWRYDEDTGEVVDKQGNIVETQMVDEDYMFTTNPELRGEEICPNCADSIDSYGNTIVVHDNGQVKPEIYKVLVYGDLYIDAYYSSDGLVNEDTGDELMSLYNSDDIHDIIKRVARVITYKRTDGWRGHYEINDAPEGMAILDYDTHLTWGAGEQELVDKSKQIYMAGQMLRKLVVFVYLRTSNVFANGVAHLVLAEDEAEFRRSLGWTTEEDVITVGD